MLFIHGCLALGGIETFYLRMAKERKQQGLKTSLLIFKSEKFSNKGLLSEIKLYASVYFINDLFYTHPDLSHNFILLMPPKKSRILELMENIDQLHSSGGIASLIGQRLLKISNKKLPITVGFYHYLEYLWGNSDIPYFIKVDRDFIFNYLPKESILFFSEGNRTLYSEKLGLNFDKSQAFRLGVVDKKDIKIKYDTKEMIDIITVGRLVKFKTYNILMLDIIKELVKEGYKIRYHIYGEGPLSVEIKDKILEMSLSAYVVLHGQLEYEMFDQVVSKADLFIGSGTAIIQAASLGVPSIVGIENIKNPKTYGYFADTKHLEYNLLCSGIVLIDIKKLIKEFISMDEEEKIILRNKHLESITDFTNTNCQEKLNQLNQIEMPIEYYRFNAIAYELSKLYYLSKTKINKNHKYHKRYNVLSN